MVLGAVSVVAWQWRSASTAAAAPNAALEPEADVCLVAPPTPYDRTSGVPLTAARPIPTQARCPVCGMFPARAPEWAAQIILSNGDAHFFDSPLSLFMFLQDVPRYSPAHHRADILAMYVSDSAQRNAPQWTDARTALYVHGSNARGPMRAGNLPAFAQLSAAQAFAQRRGGQVLRFAQVDTALIAQLAQRGGYTDTSTHEGHAPAVNTSPP